MHTQPKIRLAVYILLGIVMALGLTACRMSASTPPPTQSAAATPTQGMGIFENVNTPTPLAPAGESAGQPTGGQPGGEPNAPAAAATATPEGGAGVNTPPTAAPEVAPPPVVMVTQGPPPATYTLKAGEFPYCIARRYNLDPGELLTLNGLNNNSRPAIGTVLKLPQSGKTWSGDRALKAHPAQYTVRSGDTIYTIACAYGDVSPEMIIAANALTEPYTLSAGQVLQIP